MHLSAYKHTLPSFSEQSRYTLLGRYAIIIKLKTCTEALICPENITWCIVPKLPSSLVKEKKKYGDSNTPLSLSLPTDSMNEGGLAKGGNRAKARSPASGSTWGF